MSIALLEPSDPGYKAALRRVQKSRKTSEQTVTRQWTPFRVAEKRFMQKYPAPDLTNVLDLATLETSRAEELSASRWTGNVAAVSVHRLSGANAYIIDDVPGLVVLPAFVDPNAQRDLIRWALSDHAKAPNETNLDTHFTLPSEGLWNVYCSDPSAIVYPKPPSGANTAAPTGPRQLVNNVPADIANLQDLIAVPKLPPAPSLHAQATPAGDLLPKLRWANIGYSYHWGAKSYDFTKGNGLFPCHIRKLCQRAVASVDWKSVWDDVELEGWGTEAPEWPTWSTEYSPDAGIVNFYQLNDTLMGHVDRSEVSSTSPLVSVSLGSAAVFLIGGPTRDTEPIPIILRSGDVLIMSGPYCRRAYHGVPRILDKTLPPHLSDVSDPKWAPYASYIQSARININVRQVFPRGFAPPTMGES